MYDYLLGGKDNYAADREAVAEQLKVYPGVAFSARANRAFLGRAVRYLAAEAEIRQFLDIGTGIPTAGNTHEVAQATAPQARVVYVDYDRCKPGCTRPLSRSGCVERTRERKRRYRIEPVCVAAYPSISSTLVGHAIVALEKITRALVRPCEGFGDL